MVPFPTDGSGTVGTNGSHRRVSVATAVVRMGRTMLVGWGALLSVSVNLHGVHARPVVRNIRSTHDFDRLLEKHASETGLPVVVDFYSDSCGPCRMMAPIFRNVAAEFADRAVFVKVDTNAQPELSQRYQVRSLPTFQFFVDGKKAHQAVGGIGEQGLRQEANQIVRQAQLENVLLTLDALLEYYHTVDPEKPRSDVETVYQKCAKMNRKVEGCVGSSANALARKLKKKYQAAPQLVPRILPTDAPTSTPKPSRATPPVAAPSNTGTPTTHTLESASLADLQSELERRLDQARDEQVEHEDPAEDEADPDFRPWPGSSHSAYPEAVLVIGGGPAGLAAALYAARAGLAPLVLAPSLGGQLQGKGVDVENYPGLPLVTGPAVVAAMRKQAAHFGAFFEDDVVFRVDASQRPLQIHTNATGIIAAHSIIVATGAESNWLGIPGEWEMRGGGVSSCATCDGFLYAQRDVVVVGGGDAAMEDALVLARTSRSVTVVHRRDKFRASKVLSDRVQNHPAITVRWNATVQEILGQAVVDANDEDDNSNDHDVDLDSIPKQVTGVVLVDTVTGEETKLSCHAVFVAIGHTPATAFLQGVVDFDPEHAGYLWTQPHSTQTSVPGIFAAGDVADSVYRQAITSAGSGAAAALDAERYLSEHGLGMEEELLEAELLAELVNDGGMSARESYNAYEDAGGRMQGMKESVAAEL